VSAQSCGENAEMVRSDEDAIAVRKGRSATTMLAIAQAELLRCWTW